MDLKRPVGAVREAVSGEPGLLRLTTLLMVAAVIVCGVTTDLALTRFKALLQTVASDSAPSVVLAGLIRDSMAAMDAEAVNGFLPGAPKESFAEFGDHRNQVVNLLVKAAAGQDVRTCGSNRRCNPRPAARGRSGKAAKVGYPVVEVSWSRRFILRLGCDEELSKKVTKGQRGWSIDCLSI